MFVTRPALADFAMSARSSCPGLSLRLSPVVLEPVRKLSCSQARSARMADADDPQGLTLKTPVGTPTIVTIKRKLSGSVSTICITGTNAG